MMWFINSCSVIEKDIEEFHTDGKIITTVDWLFNLANNSEFVNMEVTPDEKVIVLSVIRGEASEDAYFITKLDNEGVQEWNKQITTSQSEPDFSIDSEGNIYLIVDGYFTFTPQLKKLDSQGNLIWEKNAIELGINVANNYGTQIYIASKFSSIDIAFDGSILISGNGYEYNLKESFNFLLQITPNFSRTYFQPLIDISFTTVKILKQTDGSFFKYYENQNHLNLIENGAELIEKIDEASGNIIWTKKYDNTLRDLWFSDNNIYALSLGIDGNLTLNYLEDLGSLKSLINFGQDKSDGILAGNDNLLICGTLNWDEDVFYNISSSNTIESKQILRTENPSLAVVDLKVSGNQLIIARKYSNDSFIVYPIDMK